MVFLLFHARLQRSARKSYKAIGKSFGKTKDLGAETPPPLSAQRINNTPLGFQLILQLKYT